MSLERLGRRPVDDQRKLPIPYVNEFPDGTHDFTAINGQRTLEVGQHMLCGLCAEPLDGSIAFMGGERKLANSVYVDPPMHESCAEEATRLCPHIVLAHAKRATDRRLRPDVVETQRSQTLVQNLDKPTVWQMTIVDDYEIGLQDDIVFFIPGKILRERKWTYVDGTLTEVT